MGVTAALAHCKAVTKAPWIEKARFLPVCLLTLRPFAKILGERRIALPTPMLAAL